MRKIHRKKTKYPLWKLMFVGKEPLDRQHTPKIIEYFWIGLGNFIAMVFLTIIFVQLSKHDGNLATRLSLIFKNFWNKLMLAFLLGNYIAVLCSCIRLIIIQKKTEEFKMFAYFVVIFSILLITSPFAFGFSLIGWRSNEIEFV